MPFIRYSRDKRGYESMVVMHAYRPGDGPQRARVLYLFRSPANLKVGRKALEPEVIEALEHTHPDLSFDWTAIRREPKPPEPRPSRQMKGRAAGRRGRPPERAQPAAPPPPDVIDDQTTLGRALGAGEAARLRRAYQDLLQRVSRRARTPEDRDRLIERAGRLNPDDWSDEATVAARVRSVEAEWDAVAAELPRRRRGRRGGRRRDEAGPEASGIMAEGADSDVESTDDALDEPDRGADAGGDDGADGDAADGSDPAADPPVPDER